VILSNNDLRRNAVKLTYVADGQGIRELATATSAHAVEFSQVHQIVNGVSHASGRFATLEPNLWRLDGSFMLPDSQLQKGFVSRQISNDMGTFPINQHPEVVVNFARPVDLPAITLVFDGDGACRNVQFLCHNEFGTIINTQFLQSNLDDGGNVLLTMTANGVDGVSRITLRLMRTHPGGRRARVTQVHFGEVVVFDGEDVLSISTLHQGDAEGKGLPWNVLRTVIANKGRFSAIDGGMIDKLARGSLLEYTIGTGDYPVGKMFWTKYADYYLDEWKVTNKQVELAGHSKTRFLSDTTFMGSNFALEHMGDLARRIGAEAGINVIPSNAMDTYPRFPAFTGNVSHRKALAYLAELAGCAIFEDRQGSIHFMDLLSHAQPDLSPALCFGQQLKPPEISQNRHYNGIMLTERMISLDDGWLANVRLDVSGFLDVTIPYDAPVWLTPTITVSAGFSLQNIQRNTMFATMRIVGNGTAEVQVRGWRCSLLATENFYPAPWKQVGEEERPYTVDLPMFITNAVHIQSVRDWFLTRKFELIQRMMKCETTWRQNPGADLGDNVMIQIDGDGRQVRGRAISQEMDFAGGVLSGATNFAVLRQ